MAKHPRVTLVKALTWHLRDGHPWVFSHAIKAPRDLVTGTVVDVVDKDGAFVARGLYDARSPLAVRVATLDEREAVDEAFVARRVADALRARRGVIDARTTTAFRWLNGEGDRLPGVVVDVYGNVAVLRLDGDAVAAWKDAVVRAVVDAGRGLGIAHVYERTRHAEGRALFGAVPPVPVIVEEHGARFAVDVVAGQKTGFFLDQRENRLLVKTLASSAETVANLFSYTGGFSVQAALGGARSVTSVDVAKAAVDAARDNFALNGLDPARHDFVAADVFAWLAEARAAGKRFGLVVVDPPSFAPSEKAVPQALKAYRKLNAQALDVVEDGGLVAFASCSSHVTPAQFLDVVRGASVDAKRPLRVLEVRGQPGDHPTPPAFPEGRYLKFVLARA